MSVRKSFFIISMLALMLTFIAVAVDDSDAANVNVGDNFSDSKYYYRVTSVDSSTNTGTASLTDYLGMDAHPTIPGSVFYNGIRFSINGVSHAFIVNENISYINVAEDSQYFSSTDGILMSKAGDTVYRCPCGYTGPVVLGKKITTIDAFAFKDCTRITSVEMSDQIQYIGHSAFMNCTNLVSFKNYGKSTLSNNMFVGCSALKNIELYDNNATGNPLAFGDCSNEFTIKACSAKIFPETMRIVEFTYCLGIESIPAGDLMESCVKTLKIPSTVKKIGTKAFLNCKELTTVIIESKLIESDGTAFDGCIKISKVMSPSAKLFPQPGNITDYTISEGVETVAPSEFSEYGNLIRLHALSGLQTIGSEAFMGLSKLNEVVLPDSLIRIEHEAFCGCLALSSVTIPSVHYIDFSAFEGCESLTSIELPSNTKSISTTAFYKCSALADVKIPKDNKNYSSENGLLFNKSKEELIWCTKAYAGELNIPDSVRRIGDSACSYCIGITSINFGRINSIPDRAFEGCTGLLKLNMSNISSIGAHAFDGCSSLEEVNLHCRTHVLDNSFSNCTNIKKITAAEMIFEDSKSSITDVTIPEGTWEVMGFNELPNLERVTFPEDLVNIYGFDHCTSLKNIFLPKNIDNFYSSFSHCTSLMDIDVSKENPHFTSVSGAVYNKDCTKLIAYPSGRTTVTLCDQVKYVDCSAFSTYNKIKCINIPGSVTSIVLHDAGIYYPALETINVDASNPNYHSENGLLYDKSMSKLLMCPPKYTEQCVLNANTTTYDENAFSDCASITSLTIQNPNFTPRWVKFNEFVNLTSITAPDKNCIPYVETLSELTLTSGPAVITDGYFSGYPALRNITLSEATTTIENGAFSDCNNLEQIFIPRSVEKIEIYVFHDCPNLKNIQIEPGNETYSFDSGCVIDKKEAVLMRCLIETAGEVRIPSSVKTIANGCFSGCSLVESVIIPENVTYVGKGAFDNCDSLNTVSIPYLAYIGDYTFTNDKKLKTVTAPDPSIFTEKSNITDFTLSDGVTEITYEMFDGYTGLDSIHIPASVETIDYMVFKDNCDISIISIDPDNQNYTVESGILFNKDKTDVLMCSKEKTGTCELPASVTTISNDAFKNCSKITTVYLPSEVYILEEGAFQNCTSLQTIIGFEHISQICMYSFANCKSLKTIDLSNLTEIPISAFKSCSSLESVTLSESLYCISGNAFYGCTNLKEITLPSALSHINNYAFGNCINLEYLFIPDNVQVMDCNAFDGCPKLTIEVSQNNQYYSSENNALFNKDKTILYKCHESTLGTYAIPESVTSISNDAFCNCIGITKISIPANTAIAGVNIFKNCEKLIEITVDANNTTLFSFEGVLYKGTELICCPAQKEGSLTLADDTTYITQDAFCNCTGITKILIPANTAIADANIFKNCEKLTEITVDANNTTLSSVDGVLYKGTELICCPAQKEGSLTLADGTVGIIHDAFFNCSKLKSITLPASLKRIDFSINECSGLESLTILNPDMQINQWMFEDCTMLKNVTAPDMKPFENMEHLTDIAFTPGITVIDRYITISNNPCRISNITIPDSVTTIGYEAFINFSGIRSLTIPESVLKIENDAFSNCTALESISIQNENVDYSTRSFLNCTSVSKITAKSFIDTGSPNVLEFTYTDGVQTISGTLCSDETRVVNIPSSVTDISLDEKKTYSSLQTINVDPLNAHYSSKQGVLYDDVSKTVMLCPMCHSGAVDIPAGITTVKTHSFYKCDGVDSITFPSTIELIDTEAFFECNNIIDLYIPGKVSIQRYAFIGCSGITSIEFSKDAVLLYDYALTGLENLRKLVIPGINIQICSYVLEDTDFLAEVTAPIFIDAPEFTFPEGVVSCNIHSNNLKELHLPASATGDISIDSESLEYIHVDLKNTKYRSHYGVLYNKSLTELFKYPSGKQISKYAVSIDVKVVHDGAFNSCKYLREIKFLNNETIVESGNFYDCPNLRTATYKSIDVFGHAQNLTEFTITPGTTDIKIPIDSIPQNLEKLNIPASVTSIEEGFFERFHNLRHITVEHGNPSFTAIDDILYTADKTTLISCLNKGITEYSAPIGLTRIGVSAFKGCTALASVKLGAYLQVIDDYAFSGCVKLSDPVFPSSLETIGYFAFDGCESITSIALPSSLKGLPGSSFANCKNLSTIEVDPGSSTLKIYNGMLANKDDNSIIKCPVSFEGEAILTFSNAVTSYAFQYCTKLTGVRFDPSTTYIGSYAFYGCTGLTGISFDPSTTHIGSYAFYGCTGLTTLDLRCDLHVLGDYAFTGCTNLSDVILGNVNKMPGMYGPDVPFSGCHLQNVTAPNTEMFHGCVISNFTFSSGASFSESQIMPDSLEHVILPQGITVIPSYKFNGMKDLRTITIPDGVTTIGSNAFNGCANLTSITLPDGVTTIGSEAFYGCTSLSSITIPDSVTTIETEAFYGCTSLSSITMRGSTVSIGSDAFHGCTGLSSITISGVNTSIGSCAFKGCTGLLSAEIPGKVETLGSEAFADCSSLKTVHIGSMVSAIPYLGFANCRAITDITIPEGVTTIEGWAFIDCIDLQTISLPNSLIEIGNCAFRNCHSITDLYLNDGLKTIGTRAFEDCFSLMTLRVPSGIQSVGEDPFEDCGSIYRVVSPRTDLIWNPCAVTEFVLSEGVTSVSDTNGNNIFNDFCNLEKVELPSTVVDLGVGLFMNCHSLISVSFSSELQDLGASTFFGATKLENITLPEKITSIGEKVFSNSGLKSITIPGYIKTIGYGAFENCVQLKTVTIMEGVRMIDSHAFSGCANLTSISLPESLCEMGALAFYDCSSLGSINIPKSTATIHAGAFINCTALTEIIIPQSCQNIEETTFRYCSNLRTVEIQASEVSIGGGAFYGCETLESIDTKKMTGIGSYAFYDCDSLVDVYIEPICSYVGEGAFANSDSIKKVSIADTTEVGKYAFSCCSSITEVILQGGISHIHSSAFSGCVNVSSVTAPDALLFKNKDAITEITVYQSMLTIPNDAFRNCHNVLSVCIPENTMQLGDRAFAGCTGLQKVIIRSALADIGSDVFKGCCNITEVTSPFTGIFPNKGIITTFEITDGVETVYTFDGYSGLVSVSIPNSVKEIGEYAFKDCKKLETVTNSSSISVIKTGTFENCINLTGIHLGEGIVTIQDDAFRNCTALSDLNVPGTLITIGSNAFYGCSNLKAMPLPNGLTSIGSNAFYGCSGLAELTIPAGLTSIGSGAFYGCIGLTTLTLPDSMTTVYSNTFHGCTGLTDLTLPRNLGYIEDSAFENCSNLKSVRFPNGLVSIGSLAFANCSGLKSIAVPFDLQYLDLDAFSGCTSLESLSIPNKGTELYGSLDGCDNLSGLTAVTPNILKNSNNLRIFICCDGVQELRYGIEGCKNLQYIYVPPSVHYISPYYFDNLQSLKQINVNDSNQDYSSSLGVLYDKNMSKLLRCPENFNGTFHIGTDLTDIDQHAFYGCDSITSFDVDENNSSYSSEKGILYNYQKTRMVLCPGGYSEELVFLDSLEYIEYQALRNIKNVPSMVVPLNLTCVDADIFEVQICNHDGTFIGHDPMNGFRFVSDPANNRFVKESLFVRVIVEGTEFTDMVKYGAGICELSPKMSNGYITESYYSDEMCSDKLDDTYAFTDPNVPVYSVWVSNTPGDITWKNYDGTVLEIQEKVEPNVVPVYSGAVPCKPSTSMYDYTFIGWTPEPVPVYGDAAYTAVFESVLRTYTVTWKNYDGSVLETDLNVQYGSYPEYNGSTPVKPTDAQYTYLFNLWSPLFGEVVSDVTYTAEFTSTLNKYTVTWKNYDGSVLETDKDVCYGEQAVYNGIEPTKAEDAQYTYCFNRWSPEPGTVASDVTYTAEFTSTLNKYTVTWKNHDGSVLETDSDVPYGTLAEYNGSEPMKEENMQYEYRFDHWTPTPGKVVSDTEYTAVFTESLRTFTVTWKNYDGSVLETDTDVSYGSIAEYNGSDPSKPSDVQYTYHFDHWTTEPGVVTSDVTYTAVFSETINTYRIVWANYDGTVLETYTAEYGTQPVYTGTLPDKTPDVKYSYVFEKWTPDVTAVVSDVTYTAEYTPVLREYTIIFDTDGGSEIDPMVLEYGALITSPSVPVKQGYLFKEWMPAIPQTVDGNMNFTAIWESNVKHNENGSTTTIDSQYVDNGTDHQNLEKTATTESSDGSISVITQSVTSENGTNTVNTSIMLNTDFIDGAALTEALELMGVGLGFMDKGDVEANIISSIVIENSGTTELTQDSLAELAEMGNSISIRSDGMDIGFDNTLCTELGKGEGPVRICVDRSSQHLTDGQKEAVKDRMHFSIGITKDNVPVASLNNPMILSFGTETEYDCIYAIDENGSETPIFYEYVDGEKTFKTSSCSVYRIGERSSSVDDPESNENGGQDMNIGIIAGGAVAAIALMAVALVLVKRR